MPGTVCYGLTMARVGTAVSVATGLTGSTTAAGRDISALGSGERSDAEAQYEQTKNQGDQPLPHGHTSPGQN